jgi:hypothetical protein
MHTNILSTLDLWLNYLDDYNEKTLITKPSPHIWSIGQVYKHLYSETTYFISQAMICCTTDENKDLHMAPEGESMFANNSFPDEQIIGPPSNDLTPQPSSIQEVSDDFRTLRASVVLLLDKMAHITYEGKTPHPGLAYFNALEWIQFADMHLRHHLKQKRRIDGMLMSIT